MELIYAWINDIRDTFFDNQDFNFSSNWMVSFDRNTEFLSAKRMKPEVKADFFKEDGKVSNITAIIGKNGTGKTRLLHRLGEIIASPYEDNYDSIVVFVNDDKIEVYNSTNSDITLHTIDNGKKINIPPHKKGKNRYSDAIRVIYYCPLFEGSFSSQINIDGYSQSKFNELWNISLGPMIYGFQELLKRNANTQSSGYSKEIADKHATRLTNAPYIIDFFFNFQSFHEIKGCISDDNFPKSINFLPEFISIATHVPDGKLNPDEQPDFVQEIGHNNLKYFLYGLIYWQQANIENHRYDIDFKDLFEQKSYQDYRNYFLGKLNGIGDNDNIDFFLKIEKLATDNVIQCQGGIRGIGAINHIKQRKELIEIFESYEKILNKLNGEHIAKYDYFLKLHWGNRRKYHFSGGERMILSLYTYLKIASTKKEKEHLILFLDECDIGLHPEWQRGFVKMLIDIVPDVFCREPNQKVQIILSSHSPFVISDLPEKNIIFLEKENNRCVVRKDRENFSKTFGAHINTLFSDSFFMKQKIGSFAEQKINGIIHKLNKKTQLTENEKYIVEILGEPLISRSIKSELQKQTEAEMIEQKDYRIKELELKIQKMENGQYSK